MSLVIFLMWLGIFGAMFFTMLSYRMALESEREKNKRKVHPPADAISDAGVRDLVALGELEQALQVYAAFTGVDEYTAQQAIRDIQREVRLSTYEPAIRAYLDKQDKAGAIEMYQKTTGADLAEALQVVERVQIANGKKSNTKTK